MPINRIAEYLQCLDGRREAKLVVLDWDDNTESIQPSSLHYFEGDATLSGGRCAFPRGPQAIADPQVWMDQCHILTLMITSVQ